MPRASNNDRLTILFIPLEPGDTGNIHRGAAMARALSWRYNVIGVARVQGFPAMLRWLSYLKLLAYWCRVLWLGVRLRREIELIFCENIHIVIGSLLSLLTRAPCVWDVETESTLYMQAWRRSRLFAAVHLLLEKLASPMVRVLIAACEEDRQRYLERGFAPGRVFVVPNSVDFSRFECAKADLACIKRELGMSPEDPLLLFSGDRAQLPNRVAAAWINAELAPALARDYPDARIALTGGGTQPSSLADNIIVAGYVPNIYDYVLAADICLAPLWEATGIPGKVIDYLVMGKAIVASRLVRGIPELDDRVTAMVAANGREFVDKTLYLLAHPDERCILGARAAAVAKGRYLLQNVAENQIYPLIESIIGTKVSV